MAYVRLITAAAVLISALASAPLLWAAPRRLSNAQKAKIRASCQAEFDRELDWCLKNGSSDVSGATCMEFAAAHWAGCMERNGMKVREGERPPGSTGVSKNRPTGQRPQVAPVTPTPGKRKEIDGGSVTTADPGRNASAAPSKRKVIDSGAVRSIESARSPTPTPFGTPRPVPRRVTTPTPTPR